MLRRAGCDWHDLAKALVPSTTRSDAGSPDSERSAIRWCYYRRHLLSLRDAKFIDVLICSWTPLSDKQCAWLDDIVAKLERVEAA